MSSAGNQQEAKKVKPKKKDIDQAFDELAQFLFDQYRKHKEKTGGAN